MVVAYAVRTAYEPLPGLRVNGRQTVGENLADLTGLTLAHDAYRRSLRAGTDTAVTDSAAEAAADRAFFLAYARVWRVRYTDEALRDKLLNSYHAPGQVRVNGAVRNIAAWYAAFGVTPADRLHLPPVQRITLW